MMTTEQLQEFVKEQVPGFVDLAIESSGTAFHYTRHSEAIKRSKQFFGAPIAPGLIATQKTAVTDEASDPNGVVFAYPKLEKAVEMGRGQDLIRIEYRSALSAFHKVERELERKHKLIDSRTVLILAKEVKGFEVLGAAEKFLP